MAIQTRPLVVVPSSRRAARWVRENLFSSYFNTFLTVAAMSLLYIIFFGTSPISHFESIVTLDWPDMLGGGLLGFLFDSAEWGVIDANRRLFFLGRFPSDEVWRVWIIIFIFSGLAGSSVGLWTRLSWQVAAVFAVLMIPVFLFIHGGQVALLTVGAIAAFGALYVAAHYAVPERYNPVARTAASVAWLLGFGVAIYMLNGVNSRLWGGLLLTLILTIVGIVASFPFGVMLALGRASTFPVVRAFCTAYIELVRAVPLITILFMANFFLPLMTEPEERIFGIPFSGMELDEVYRAMVAITLFSAAYIAENVRGGLQSVPRGQVEAAEALGLTTWRILALIVLPQAIRAVIPSLVGQFISLFKDTSLVYVLALTELLGVAGIVTSQPGFFGRQAEALLFAALLYWVIAFSMSQASQRLERNLGVGQR